MNLNISTCALPFTIFNIAEYISSGGPRAKYTPSTSFPFFSKKLSIKIPSASNFNTPLFSSTIPSLYITRCFSLSFNSSTLIFAFSLY
ncbi:hypothetical protein OMAG_000465 [Candidatus Omnitrophus magneticus]|uniref:Uncharacterized protein n=1 Tax=Candidatus Omnitrophus magneticus TaxID=1609969 RepID=A0A0F0CQX6_9BACT|nr:hypothetical protein OMAG_000465 [Candidatus Omnitrophus magneticus]